MKQLNRARIVIGLIVLLCAFIRIRQYPCSTPDCPNTCFLDGDLCRDCHVWLAACEPLIA